ncbi:MAG: hypothetical protein Q9166_003815 [cf. Caloplaca sp. 2 TL-2023]
MSFRILFHSLVASVCVAFAVTSDLMTVISPLESPYPLLSTENWSQTAWKKPTCIAQPTYTADLQKVVRQLTKESIPFAVRSGGHSPSPFAANIDNGVLIDMSRFNHTQYDSTRNVAIVGAGGKWLGVYNELDRHNVTVVGGRVLDVGVGGLILGCGLSYLSDLYGLACDNVVNFEVVLANGTVANANAKRNQDLFLALKGGANNFGVVTAFTLKTHPINQVWGGIKSYSLDQLPALFTAMQEYQSNPKKDLYANLYANLMLQAFTTNASVGAVLNMVYLKPQVNASAFAPFYSIPTTGDTTKIQTLTQMMAGQRVPPLTRWDWFATSFRPSSSLYQKIANIVTTAPELATIQSTAGGSLAIGVQPISTKLVQAGNAQGGNALGLKNADQTWFVLDAGWIFADGDAMVHNATRALIARIEDEAKKEGLFEPYQFMNDASWDQDVIGHYGEEGKRRMRQASRKYDPEGVFQNLVSGGWKLPKGSGSMYD